MLTIDSHCHMADMRFDMDRSAVLERSREAGIAAWVVPSASFSEWETIRNLSRQFDGVHTAFGVHPWFCAQWHEGLISALREYLNGAVAIGECGLDLGPGHSELELQLACFREQLHLARQLDLPVILHAHKSLDLVLREIRRVPGLRGVVHGFAGSLQQAQQCIELGLYIGVGGRMTYPQAERLRTTLVSLPLSALLLESDAPDQPPFRYRFCRNEPFFLVEIESSLATIRAIDPAILAEACDRNARELFRL